MNNLPPWDLISLSDDRTISSMISSRCHPVRAIVNGATCVVYSSLKKDELKWIKAHYPDILRVIGEDGQPSFEVTVDDTMPGSVEDNLVVFGAPVSAEGYATITILVDPEAENVEDLVMEKFREPLQHLAEIEESIFMILKRQNKNDYLLRTQIIKM